MGRGFINIYLTFHRNRITFEIDDMPGAPEAHHLLLFGSRSHSSGYATTRQSENNQGIRRLRRMGFYVINTPD